MWVERTPMEIESIVEGVLEVKEVKLEVVIKGREAEDEVTRVVRCLRDISILKVSHSSIGLPDNDTKIILRLKLEKPPDGYEWVGPAISTALGKTTLNFNHSIS